MQYYNAVVLCNKALEAGCNIAIVVLCNKALELGLQLYNTGTVPQNSGGGAAVLQYS